MLNPYSILAESGVLVTDSPLDSPGFNENRMIFPYMLDSMILLEDGAATLEGLQVNKKIKF